MHITATTAFPFGWISAPIQLEIQHAHPQQVVDFSFISSLLLSRFDFLHLRRFVCYNSNFFRFFLAVVVVFSLLPELKWNDNVCCRCCVVLTVNGSLHESLFRTCSIFFPTFLFVRFLCLERWHAYDIIETRNIFLEHWNSWDGIHWIGSIQCNTFLRFNFRLNRFFLVVGASAWRLFEWHLRLS